MNSSHDATSNETSTQGISRSSSSNSDKVKVHFVAVGSAPILKRTKFQIGADQPFASMHLFLRKQLQLPSHAPLFLYCQSAFVPAPDHVVRDLRDAFAAREELVIHYSLQEAWG